MPRARRFAPRRSARNRYFQGRGLSVSLGQSLPEAPLRILLLVLAFALLPSPLHAEEKPVDVVIVGAGLAGLSTAYRLQKAGLTYRIVELSPHIGGRMRTARYPEGVRAELGLEEFWKGNP